MSALTMDILVTLFVILTLFITPDTVVTYPRDRLLSLRNHRALLNHGQRSLSQLGLRRRGCRAGAHCQRRLTQCDVIHHLYVYTRGNPDDRWTPHRVCKQTSAD